tara:strand:- start:1155 stop:3110 length:1956 start_codon:yes stop_codon:yes gene_type:complete
MSLHIRTPEDEVKSFQDRYKFIYLTIGLTFLLFTARLWYLQIYKGSEFRYYSEKNVVKFQKLMAPRGRFLDRNGFTLVDNHPGFEATITPQFVEDLDKTAEKLSNLLNLSKTEIISKVKTSARREGRYRPVRIKENLNRDEVARVERIRLDYPGVDINMFIKRTYSQGEIGAQLLGYTGEISKQQLPKLNKGLPKKDRFRQGDILGRNGLEKTFDKELRGEDGLDLVQVDARGRIAMIQEQDILSSLPRKQDPVPGNNIVLTIDKDLQSAAAEAMAAKDYIGAMIAIDPNNGEILTWVNEPSFDPNNFSTGISKELWSKLTNDPFKPLRNKVVQDHYPPGSTFKAIVALAALEEKVIKPSTKIFCPGHIRFGRKVYHCWRRGGHGEVNLTQAIEQSCNVYFYKLGSQLGIDTMAKYAKALGIGQKTGIQVENEISGLMPTEKWKEDNFGEPWQPGENLSNAIGQGFVLTTPIQLVLAYSGIGMEGPIYKPHIIKKILSPEEEVIYEAEKEVLHDPSDEEKAEVHISSSSYKTVKMGLYKVANGEKGTAKWYKIPNIKFAGKTGTVQNFSLSSDQVYEKCEERPKKQRHHGWFVAYAPYDKPKIAVAILAEHACAGSKAAPVVRDLMWAYFKKYHPEMLEEKKENTNLSSLE